MNIAIIGSGGREHAICEYINKSNKLKKIFCIPGNAGTEDIAINIEIDINDFEKIRNFIISNNVNLLIIGPEKPLVDGLVDYLQNLNIKIFGPSKKASQLEGSKIFTKEICKKYNIPTAEFGVYKNLNEAKKFLENNKYPIVIKADGLAAGKGVYICEDEISAVKAIKEVFDGKFGTTDKVLVEEFISGEEMSYLSLPMENQLKNLAQHKTIKEFLKTIKVKIRGVWAHILHLD